MTAFKEILIGSYALRFWPSDNGWMCGITSQMMDALKANEFNPDWDTQAVLTEEIQRMAKRIEELEAKDEPVAWRTFDGEGGYDYRTYDMNENYLNEWNERNPKHNGWVEPLYTNPSQRTWVGLTDEEIMEMLNYGQYGRVPQYARNFVDAIEAKLKEKNT